MCERVFVSWSGGTYVKMRESKKRLGLPQAPPRAPYADDPPREITDEDLSFLSDYTGERDLAVLRRHVLKVWAAVKAKVREQRVPSCY